MEYDQDAYANLCKFNNDELKEIAKKYAPTFRWDMWLSPRYQCIMAIYNALPDPSEFGLKLRS